MGPPARTQPPSGRQNPTRMQGSPPAGPAQAGQYWSEPRQSVRSGRRNFGWLPAGQLRAGAVTIRGRRGKPEIAISPAGTQTGGKGSYRSFVEQQVMAFYGAISPAGTQTGGKCSYRSFVEQQVMAFALFDFCCILQYCVQNRSCNVYTSIWEFLACFPVQEFDR